METTLVRDFYGRIIGKIETDDRGNKTIRNFYGWILGRYDAATDTTRDFYGRIVAKGDASGMLINQNQNQITT